MLQIGRLGTLPLDMDATRAFLNLMNHLSRGRDGNPWCVWSVRAMERNSFWVADARMLRGIDFRGVIMLAADAFVKHCQVPYQLSCPQEAPINALTILLPDEIDYNEAEEILQRERRALLTRGLMAGLLHPLSTHRPLTPGPFGMPYRTDSPFLTIRWAVAADELFVGINPELLALLRTWTTSQKENWRQPDDRATEPGY
jgi:hypothetical protein